MQALVAGLLFLSTHPAIRCPAAAVFDVRVEFGIGGHEYTKVSDAVFLFNHSPGWSLVYGFILCFTISHQFKFVAFIVSEECSIHEKSKNQEWNQPNSYQKSASIQCKILQVHTTLAKNFQNTLRGYFFLLKLMEVV